MILYDWHKIYRATDGNLIEVLRIIDSMTYKKIPRNRKDKLYKYSNINFVGDCYLYNPEQLLSNRRRFSSREIVEYIALAARRNLADYLGFGHTHLDLIQLNIAHEKYFNNRLLYVRDNRLFFLYEELKKEKRNGVSI